MNQTKNVPTIEANDEQIDIEAEKLKSENCPFWTDKTAYFGGFDLSEFTEEELPHIQDLLWAFRHCFYNPDHPEMFQKHVDIKPIKIETLPGVRPKKDKKRTMSPTKEALLKTHIDRLVAEGVIEELKDVEDCHASNVVVVVEQRYHAVEKKMVTKSRVTIDMRSLNLAIPSSSYPIPDMEAFRRDITQEGFKCFSNLDCQTWYHQLPVDPECGKKLFGFYALNRLFFFKRMPQGLKSSPPVAQAFVDKAYDPHPRARGFLDDVTTYSKTRKEMLFKDLPLTLAIASRYNILFKREKADLMRPYARVLGHKISEGSHSGLSSEKVEKIRDLPFPTNKKELVSRLAFFNFFNHTCPRLSEILAPLRRMTKKNVRFKDTTEHRTAFQEAKDLLLHPELGAIRTPSTDINHPVCVFTDASAQSYSGIICQLLPPTSKEQAESDEKKLYIVGAWSGVVTDTMLNFPIYLKELYALAETFIKYKWFLSFREVIVCTDSQTISWWTSLSTVSDDVARRLNYIQKFNYKILYIASEVNPADTFTRLCSTERQGIYEKFAHDRVYNANGEKIDPSRLFSENKMEASDLFFTKRRQALSKPVKKVPNDLSSENKDQNDIDDIDEDSFVIKPSLAATISDAASTMPQPAGPGAVKLNDRTNHLKKSLETCQVSLFQGSIRGKHRCSRRRKSRRMTRQLKNISPTEPENGEKEEKIERQPCLTCHECMPLLSKNVVQNNDSHCTCTCSRNDQLNAKLATLSVASIEIDDADFEAGRVQLDADTLTDDAVSAIPQPVFDEITLDAILKMQESDNELKQCRRYLEGETLPSKEEASLLPSNIQDFLRNLSSFCLTSQNVITRIWLEPNGQARHLLMLGHDAFVEILKSTHELKENNTVEPFAHLGIRKTRTILGKHFYAFKMRKNIEQYINNCPICKLNNTVVTHRDPLGNQIAPEGGCLLVIDYVGPWGSFATSSSGQRRYIFVAVDANTRFAYTCVSNSTSDEDTLKNILAIRHQATGLYKRYQMDNAICTKNSKTKAYLEANGVSVSHGLPNNSLSQCKAERFIGTLSRQICKYHTALPGLDFHTLVAEATMTYNCSPHSALPAGLSPRDLHFARPAISFFNADSAPITGQGMKPKVKNALKAAREAGMETLRNDVSAFIRRQTHRSPRNITAQLQIGDLCLKKRSSFAQHAPQKLQFKVNLEAYEIIGKLATNAFKVQDLANGEISLLSGDVLIRVRGHTKSSLLKLVQSMERTAQSNEPRAEGPTTRSRAAQNASLLSEQSLVDAKYFFNWATAVNADDSRT